MIKGSENILKLLRDNKAAYWRLLNREGGSVIAETDDKDMTTGAAETHLKNFIELLGPGTYFIEMWDKPGDNRGRKKTPFELYGADGKLPQQAQIGAIPGGQSINDMINEALEKERMRNSIERLTAQLAEKDATIRKHEATIRQLEQDADNVGTRIFSRIEPFIGHFIPNGAAAAAAPAQVAGNATDVEKRLEAAFDHWQKKEADPVTIVERIAALSHDDPGTYAMARGILLK